MVVLALAVLAALRVAFYAAAFPFANNLDELPHYDVVVRWSEGQPPRAFSAITPATAATWARTASPEFLWLGPDAPPPPPARLPEPDRTTLLANRTQSAQGVFNHEMLQPPLYYAAAGAWRAAWRALGLGDDALPYAVRGLNVLVIFATVLVAAAFARRAFPGDRFGQLAVPALVAVMPQDVYYGISNDVFSALLAGGVAVLLLDLMQPNAATLRGAVAAGLLAACAIMSKLSNILILAPLLGACALGLHQARRDGWPRPAVVVPLALALSALAPLALWMTGNHLVFGDLTGGVATARASGWTPKPVSAWFNHPLLMPRQAAAFIVDIVLTLWRGELVWHGARLAHRGIDALYLGATALGLTGALLATAQSLRRRPDHAARALLVGWLATGAGVGFLVYVSLAWDFGDWFYPSRACPILSSGRLILGMLVPLAALLVAGLNHGAARLHILRARAPALVVLLTLSLASELALSLPAIASPWNAFHLLAR